MTSVTTMGSSPASASYYEEGIAFTGRIVRDSVLFKLRVKAIEAMGGSFSLEVSLSKLKDPSGPTKIEQEQTWIYGLEEGDFYQEGRTFHVEAGHASRPFELHVHAERRRDASCSQNQPLFMSIAEGGDFRIETGNDKFGTITELPRCGKEWFYSSGMPPERCPLSGTELQAPRIAAWERRNGEAVRIGMYRSRQRTISNEQVTWDLRLRGSLPAKRFRLDGDLDGSLAAGGAPWLEGTALFDAKGALRGGDWFDCEENKEARTVYRSGSLGGDLTLHQIGYGPRPIRNREAFVRRSWVRPRT